MLEHWDRIGGSAAVDPCVLWKRRVQRRINPGLPTSDADFAHLVDSDLDGHLNVELDGTLEPVCFKDDPSYLAPGLVDPNYVFEDGEWTVEIETPYLRVNTGPVIEAGCLEPDCVEMQCWTFVENSCRISGWNIIEREYWLRGARDADNWLWTVDTGVLCPDTGEKTLLNKNVALEWDGSWRSPRFIRGNRWFLAKRIRSWPRLNQPVLQGFEQKGILRSRAGTLLDFDSLEQAVFLDQLSLSLITLLLRNEKEFVRRNLTLVSNLVDDFGGIPKKFASISQRNHFNFTPARLTDEGCVDEDCLSTDGAFLSIEPTVSVWSLAWFSILLTTWRKSGETDFDWLHRMVNDFLVGTLQPHGYSSENWVGSQPVDGEVNVETAALVALALGMAWDVEEKHSWDEGSLRAASFFLNNHRQEWSVRLAAASVLWGVFWDEPEVVEYAFENIPADHFRTGDSLLLAVATGLAVSNQHFFPEAKMKFGTRIVDEIVSADPSTLTHPLLRFESVAEWRVFRSRWVMERERVERVIPTEFDWFAPEAVQSGHAGAIIRLIAHRAALLWKRFLRPSLLSGVRAGTRDALDIVPRLEFESPSGQHARALGVFRERESSFLFLNAEPGFIILNDLSYQNMPDFGQSVLSFGEELLVGGEVLAGHVNTALTPHENYRGFVVLDLELEEEKAEYLLELCQTKMPKALIGYSVRLIPDLNDLTSWQQQVRRPHRFKQEVSFPSLVAWNQEHHVWSVVAREVVSEFRRFGHCFPIVSPHLHCSSGWLNFYFWQFQLNLLRGETEGVLVRGGQTFNDDCEPTGSLEWPNNAWTNELQRFL